MATIHHRLHAFFLHHYHHGYFLLLLLMWRNQTSKPEELSENVLTGHMNSSDVSQPSKNNTIG